MSEWINKCHFGDVRDVLRQMIDAGVKVNCIVTSPPYWGLRSYLPADHPDKAREIGSEPTLREFISTMTDVFMLAREVLADDGTCWINMGDSYAANGGAHGGRQDNQSGVGGRRMYDAGGGDQAPRRAPSGLKPKDLVGQPWRLAFALQDAGWYLRQDIIWSKPSPMPESVRDRCTKAHEYLFLMTKSERYWWDFEAMQEPVNGGANPRRANPEAAGTKRPGFGHGYDEVAKPRYKTPDGWDTRTGQGGHGSFHAEGREKGRVPGNVNPPKGQAAYEAGDDLTGPGYVAPGQAPNTGNRKELRSDIESRHRSQIKGGQSMQAEPDGMRNRRSVWTVPTAPYSGAHFATFPPALIEPCILAGCPAGGVVLDIFIGSGTTGAVAKRLGRNWIGIDIDERNAALQRDRISPQESFVLEAA